ncbi:MAG: spore maturation protein [Acholeplasmataceae bacterium]|nr:spore maturation protein [Acholeplasmataceae bacterium]
MINRIWVILLFWGIVVSALTGKFASLGNIMLNSAQEALDLFLKIATMLIFWSGIIRIALDAGLINKIAKLLLKPLSRIFPDLPQNSKALELIAGNVVCNLLGLGSAATPLGLKAMAELQKENPHPEEATRSMSTFVLLNAASLTVFPASLFGLRTLYGANDTIDLILLLSITSALATAIALTSDRLFHFWCSRKKP